MGAFVLFHESRALDTARSRAVFRSKGLSEPSEFSLGATKLLLFPKQMFPVRNWFDSESGCRLFCTGAPIYKGLGYADGMRELLRDWESGNVIREELVGFYCLLFFDGTRVSMATDPSGLYHVFSNVDGMVISNSLQAVLVADGARHTVNRDTLLEQLLTGSIAGPDTLFADIMLLTKEAQRTFKSPVTRFESGELMPDESDRQCTGSLRECVEHQLGVLRGYFTRMRKLTGRSCVSLGLSGGYDSRLLLLLAREAGLPVSAHTYSSGAHNAEQSVAEELARCTGIQLAPIVVKTWEHLNDEERTANMGDALSYWDGRTNLTMGSFNDVHTKRVRMTAIGSAGLSLNGMGGELYRNPEHLPDDGLDFDQWFRYFVLKPGCAAAIRDKKAMEALSDRLGQKYARLMRVHRFRRLGRHLARSWYRDVWLPYNAGPKLGAENQLSFALMPFADGTVSTQALRATPHIGVGGVFEAAMIRALDPAAARITSNYGHGFDQVPLRTRVSEEVKSRVPLGLKLRFHTRKVMSAVSTQRPGATPEPPLGVEEGLRVLKGINLPVNWDVLLSNDVNRDRCYYIAYFLSSFREYLRFDSGGMTEF